jgi:hypothetical protein
MSQDEGIVAEVWLHNKFQHFITIDMGLNLNQRLKNTRKKVNFVARFMAGFKILNLVLCQIGCDVEIY